MLTRYADVSMLCMRVVYFLWRWKEFKCHSFTEKNVWIF